MRAQRSPEEQKRIDAKAKKTRQENADKRKAHLKRLGLDEKGRKLE